MTTIQRKISLDSIKLFLDQKDVAIAGISRKPEKFGNAIFKEMTLKGFHLYPVHPEIIEHEGVQCFSSIEKLPSEVTALIICTKPDKTLQLVKDAIDKGIHHIWLQQGAKNEDAVNYALNHNINLIYGRCILMFADPVNSVHKFHRFISMLFGAYPR